MPEHPDRELMAEFITESSEQIQNAEEALLSLEHDSQDMEAVGKVFRAFHTVKGTAGFLELTLIAELGHHAEALLSRVRDGEIHYIGDILVAQGKVQRDQLEKALRERPDEKTGMALVKAQAASVTAVSQALRTQEQMRYGG
jgi:chemotaxis protein histidine kinase CheA